MPSPSLFHVARAVTGTLGVAMKNLSWKLVLSLVVGIPVVNQIASYLGTKTAEFEIAR